MAAGQAPRGSAYFEKKGEVHELRQLLRGAAADRDQQKKRDAIKKVIAYMTLGIDVSPLFSEMVMASATTDLVQKKMVYLYLVNYAESNSELAILAINTLQKDSRDDDPMIRGLALRSLCSLNISNTVEYLQPAVQRCLEDVNGYVRKTAVVGAVKLFHISRHAVLETKIIEIMKRMIKDSDPHVVANTIYAIEEVLVDEGGLEPNKEMVTTLLNKLNQFSEWGQCAVLRLLTKYQVEDETEMFDIMNVLDGLLKQSSSAVVLNVTKIFLDLTCNRPDLMFEVLRRLKGPLLTLMSVATPELAYTVLVHIQALCTRGGLTLDCFSPEFKQFFCRYNDPSYIKNVKIDVLTMLASNTNFEPIVAELSEYVTDVDATISRQAVRAIGKLAVRVAAASEMVVSTLTGLLELDIDYVSTEAAVVMKDLVRKYPQQFQRASTAVERCLKIVTEPEGKCAILWILGEYGLLIQDAPYLLEPMIDGFLEEPSGAVKLEMLSAAVKLFFCRAPEMQTMLSRLLHKGIQETNHPDVRDRALLYYRLLEISPEEARRVICAPKEVVEEFMEELDLEAKERIFEEFNTLSVVYKQPASKFVVGKVPSSFLGASRMPPPPGSGNYSDPVVAFTVTDVNGHFDTPPVEVPAPRAPRVESSDLLGGGMMDIGEPLQNGYEPVKSISGNIPTSATSPSLVGDLLGMDDLLGGVDDMLGGGSSPAGSPSFSLSSSALMDSQTFQTRWAVLAQLPTQQRQMRPGMVTTEAIQDALRRYNVSVIASGAVGNSMKFYFFAKQECGPLPALHGNDVWFLVELLVVPGGLAQCSLKADNAQPASVECFYGVLWEALSAFVQ